jgi:hypothetical protein
MPFPVILVYWMGCRFSCGDLEVWVGAGARHCLDVASYLAGYNLLVGERKARLSHDPMRRTPPVSDRKEIDQQMMKQPVSEALCN